MERRPAGMKPLQNMAPPSVRGRPGSGSGDAGRRPAAAIRLSPTQQAAHDRALVVLAGSPLVMIEGESGMGKTTVMKALRDVTGGAFLTVSDFEAVLNHRSPSAYEQSIYEVVSAALDRERIVYIDSVERLSLANWLSSNRRQGVFNLVFRALFERTAVGERQIVLGHSPLELPPDSNQVTAYRPVSVNLPGLRAADYQHIVVERLGEAAAAGIDFVRVHHHARRLSAYDLNIVAGLLTGRGLSSPTTDDVIGIIEAYLQHSNVDVAEVEAIDLSRLVGVEEIVETLERTVLLPLKAPDLAAQLGLEAKHGVLLHGPPGSGKTTIGRGLAHMMRGKFFMIDGDTNHEAGDFFYKVDRIFDRAVANSPSVIFIDDADVILSDPQMQHFGRYLLTKLDGIQSESMARVCVMMTAMRVSDMPPPLLRSGRMEVWLEVRLPAEEQRKTMIEAFVARVPAAALGFDATTLARHTEGFTPADLRRMVSDAVEHLAFDRHSGAKPKSIEAYLDLSARDLRQQKALVGARSDRRGGRRRH